MGLWTSLGGEEHGEIPCSGESHRVSGVEAVTNKLSARFRQ
jgi:hypothetical protein